MPFRGVSVMDLKREFVLQSKACKNFSELCKRYGVSRKTGYKWLNRYKQAGELGLQEHARTPAVQPKRTCMQIEQLVIEARQHHPHWGARKLHRYLLNKGHQDIPTPSTIGRILHRNGYIQQDKAAPSHWQRFEHLQPNDLWQMDFKGHFAMTNKRCHPLTLLDDCSRFSLKLKACLHERGDIVQTSLTEVFRQYGLPARINVDNGPPWGASGQRGYTKLALWLIRLGVSVSFSRPWHPQTNGKVERFHRTLKAELLQSRVYSDLPQVQRAFDDWRDIYNLVRPHEALGLDTPVSRYQPSQRTYPEQLLPIEYGSQDKVRKVSGRGYIQFQGTKLYVSEGAAGQYVAIRPTAEDGHFHVFFCHQKIQNIDLKNKKA